MEPNGRYRRLIHLLNQRYRREFDRAEQLRAQLADIQASRAWRLLSALRRLRAWFAWFTRKEDKVRSSVGTGFLARPARADGLGRPSHLGDRVSIIIPFKDRLDLLKPCLNSIRSSTHRRYRILLVDNGSVEARTHRFLARLKDKPGCEIISSPGEFNFSRLCNEGARRAGRDFLLFLNNDTEVLHADWLEELLRVAHDPLAGIVGATLYYPDLTIQHAGIVRDESGRWTHAYRGKPADFPGDGGELQCVREVPAVTGACLLIRRDLFHELGGFDEGLPVTGNDIDLCKRVRQRGLCVLVTPHTRLLHYESLSRGYAVETAPCKQEGR
jgi:GT2 family glycosyltransferase